MTWFDYLRGYEEGHYEGRIYGRGSCLLGGLLQLLLILIFIVITFTWFICKAALIMLWKSVKNFAGKQNKF